MQVATTGLVLRQVKVGEADRILTIEDGKIISDEVIRK